MDTFENKVTCLSDYVEKACSERCADSIFRGAEDAAQRLVPPLGRAPRWAHLAEADERAMHYRFRQEGMPWVADAAKLSLGDWAALAHEHRLPGRLLAWTRWPLVALWYACQGSPKVAGVVYVHPIGGLEEAKPADPLGGTQVSLLVPSTPPAGTAPRTVYTVHPDPRTEWAPTPLIVLHVSGLLKRHMRRDLERLGLDDAVISPGLTGVARALAR